MTAALTNGQVRIRNTHPGLYRWIMTLALISGALALNYWFAPPPTFRPYNISENVIGAIFCSLAVWQLAALNVFHHLRMVRLGEAASFLFLLVWGVVNTQQGFAGKASFALPIFCIGIAALHVWALIESAVNPAEQREE